MRLNKGFKNILITDYDLIQEIDEIRDKKNGVRIMLDELSKISGKVEADRFKWWNKVKKIYNIRTEDNLTYDHPTYTISKTKKDEDN